MISQEARKAVPLKWTFRFRFAKPTEKRVQEIDLNSTFFKNVSGCWSAWNDRVLISPLFFTLILQKWTKTDTQFWKVQSTKSENSCKNHQVLVTENWENGDHFGHFGFSSRSTNFFILHRFSEISQKVFPTFFTFFFWKVHRCFQVVKYTVFLALSGCCSLEALKHTSWKAPEQAPLEHFDRFGPRFWKKLTQNNPDGLSARSTNFLT